MSKSSHSLRQGLDLISYCCESRVILLGTLVIDGELVPPGVPFSNIWWGLVISSSGESFKSLAGLICSETSSRIGIFLIGRLGLRCTPITLLSCRRGMISPGVARLILCSGELTTVEGPEFSDRALLSVLVSGDWKGSSQRRASGWVW